MNHERGATTGDSEIKMGKTGGWGIKLHQPYWPIWLNWKLFSLVFRLVINRKIPSGHFGTKHDLVSGLVLVSDSIL